jgi:hypothetical protein
MSTKVSLAHGPNFHFYTECFEDECVYLSIKNAQFEINNHHVMIEIPVAMWEVIRHYQVANIEWADKTNDEIAQYVEAKVRDRLAEVAEASDQGKKWVRMFGSAVYGDANLPEHEQIARGVEHFQYLRTRQQKTQRDILDLQKMQMPSDIVGSGIDLPPKPVSSASLEHFCAIKDYMRGIRADLDEMKATLDAVQTRSEKFFSDIEAIKSSASSDADEEGPA